MKHWFLIFLGLLSCGDPTIDIGDRYEPKIVIEALLFPDQSVQSIRLTRNVPLGTYAIDAPPLSGAQVILTDETTSLSRSLVYHSKSETFRDTTWLVEYGHSYRLDVDVTIDAVTLHATSRTTTPLSGFMLSDHDLDSLVYNARDGSGTPVKIGIPYVRSVSTVDYIFSIQALDATVDNFIYSPINPIADVKRSDVADEIDDWAKQLDYVINAPANGGQSIFNVELFHTWFYGPYRAIVYAADRNFRDFLITHENVQEPDGNYHEPVFHIDGDGIGVFGSAIADTAYFTILHP